MSVNSGKYLPRRNGSVNIHRYSPPLRRIIVKYHIIPPFHWKRVRSQSECYFNPFTSKNDQFQISCSLTRDITSHSNVWRPWLFIAYSELIWLSYNLQRVKLMVGGIFLRAAGCHNSKPDCPLPSPCQLPTPLPQLPTPLPPTPHPPPLPSPSLLLLPYCLFLTSFGGGTGLQRGEGR